MNRHAFASFLSEFEPLFEKKCRQHNQALWLLETTGSEDAATLKADLDAQIRYLLSDPAVYRCLQEWDRDPALQDPILKRELNVLLRAFRQNQLSKELLEETAKKEAALARDYANFRPKIDGKALFENELRDIFKSEMNPKERKRAWEASKEIGSALAPQILALVDLRNRAARELGFPDYFKMQLELQEVNGPWLLALFDNLALRSDEAYQKMMDELISKLSTKFRIRREEFGPWAWSDPFCQEDPLDVKELDELAKGVDMVAACKAYYARMGFDVDPILARSDLYERPGKNQHAFCIHVDKRGDVRTLNNLAPSIKWLETLLHELGHAIYETGFDESLPWLLREPPHMISTEAMALIAGRQAYRKESLPSLIGKGKEKIVSLADESLKRRQLIFSRWVMTMTIFESELYRNPEQDLNTLWWKLVERFQKIPMPSGREGQADWAAKYHIGLAPVYYFSYLLGELFASSIQDVIEQEIGSRNLDNSAAGFFLRERLFAPGCRWSWSELVRNVVGKELSPEPWLREFASCGKVEIPL